MPTTTTAPATPYQRYLEARAGRIDRGRATLAARGVAGLAEDLARIADAIEAAGAAYDAVPGAGDALARIDPDALTEAANGLRQLDRALSSLDGPALRLDADTRAEVAA